MKTLNSFALVILLGAAVMQSPCGPGQGYESRYPWLDLKTPNGAQTCRNYEQAHKQREQQAQQYYRRQHAPNVFTPNGGNVFTPNKGNVFAPQQKGTRP